MEYVEATYSENIVHRTGPKYVAAASVYTSTFQYLRLFLLTFMRTKLTRLAMNELPVVKYNSVPYQYTIIPVIEIK